MRKTLLLAFVFLFSASFPAQNLDWVYYLTQTMYTGSLDNSNSVSSIVVDSEENVYMVGSFIENLGFDHNTPTGVHLTSSNGSEFNNCYIVKLDKNKNYLWHKTISTDQNSLAAIYSIVIDKSDNVIIAGTARGNNINLNPGSSTPIL